MKLINSYWAHEFLVGRYRDLDQSGAEHLGQTWRIPSLVRRLKHVKEPISGNYTIFTTKSGLTL